MTEPTIVQTVASDAPEATFVLLNPGGMDGGCWRFLGYEDAQPFHYPGHGDRPRQADWTFAQIADEVVARYPGPLHVLGISIGGAITAQILARHPNRVRSAVIACTAGLAKGVNRDERLRMANTRAEPARRGGMQAAFELNLPRWFTPFAIRTGHPGIEYTRDAMLALDPESWVDIWMAQAHTDPLPAEQLRAVTVPVTLIVGMHDRACGVCDLAALHERLPRSRMEVIAAPHMIHLERPESLASAIDRHFTWQRTGQRVDAILSSSAL